jgi:transposase InsO family protein
MDNRQDVIKWLKILDTKFETAGIPDIKKFDLISQLLDKGALDWFQEHKTKFNHSWSDFVDHFKKAFDSPNRARIAMQKLTSYAQSPSQDIRSFCSEMRKLFQEADPQMSSMMKLELLLAKVKPSYRLDLLKQKPKDPDEFETMAKDLENTYLVLDAIEQNIQSNQPTTSTTTTTTTTSTYPFNALSPPASVRPSATPYNNDKNQNRYLKPPRYGPFPESPQGNKYILVITDLFTRFVTAIPLPKNTAELTALALFRHIFCRFGVCSTLITDQGTHFNNNLMRALTHLIGFNHILSTPYHPQTNGVVERFNASMVVQIAKLQQKHHNNWDDYLDAIVFAYNTSQHRSTKFSPFELLFGRSPHLPIDSPPRYFQFDRPNDHFLNLQKVLQVYHQQAKENSVNQQRYNKQHYDRNRSDPHYNIGDRVFTKIFSTRGKLDPRFSVDPHIVVRANHPTYIVLHEPSGVEYQYHVSDLRPVISALEDDSFL